MDEIALAVKNQITGGLSVDVLTVCMGLLMIGLICLGISVLKNLLTPDPEFSLLEDKTNDN